MKNFDLLEQYKTHNVNVAIKGKRTITINVYEFMRADDLFMLVVEKSNIVIDNQDAKTWLPLYQNLEEHIEEICNGIDIETLLILAM